MNGVSIPAGIFAGIFYGLIALAPVLIALAWRRLIKRRSTLAVVLAAVITGSYIYLLGALHFRTFLLGQDYSARLYWTCDANWLSALAAGTLSAFRRSPVRSLLASSGGSVGLAWFSVRAINSVV